MVSTVFRYSLRLLFWKMSEKDHNASLYDWVPAAFCMHNSLEQPFSLSLLLKKLHSRLIYYRLHIVKTTCKKLLKCFYKHYGYYLEFSSAMSWPLEPVDFLYITSQTNGGILDIKIIFMEQKEHLLYDWESRECKHPKIIKGKWFTVLLFWLSWPIYLTASCL